MTLGRSHRILIADDEPLYVRTTAELLRRAGFECRTAPDADQALGILAVEPIDLMIVDLNMPGNLELELLNVGRRRYPEVPMIVVTGAPSLHSAIDSVRLGLTDYLLKPVKFEDLLASVRRALYFRTISQQASPTEVQPPDDADCLLEGESPQIAGIRDLIRRAAATDVSVLITGESGTGKELAAQSLHRASCRRNAPFVTIDCTAIPESLFESVLFGHRKGAFTGATVDQPGLLRGADGGTVFLDEIGELPLSSQSKLLRLLQHSEFIPVGSSQVVSIDVRYVAATNRNLEEEVRRERFRRDLFYRMAVVPIIVPPLRERGDDVILLAHRFLQGLRRDVTNPCQLSPEAKLRLRNYSWPGNVRELRNVIERAVALSDRGIIEVEDLGPLANERTSATQSMTATLASREEMLTQSDRGYLEDLLRQNAGNVSQAATAAGVTRQGFYKLLQKYGIVPSEFRS